MKRTMPPFKHYPKLFKDDTYKFGCGARQCGEKCYPTLPLLRDIFVPLFTYYELVTSQVNPQQHKQPTNTTTMVMEPLTPPVAWIQ
jgi:hypothetical protein